MTGWSGPPLLALVGPTASGKTEASIGLAERLDAEVVNVDSTLVFRGMDVWTGKPTAEQRARVPHHVIDITDPSGPISVQTFAGLAWTAIDDIHARGRRALLVGGSGLYFRTVVDRLQPPPTDVATRALLAAEAGLIGARRMHERLTAVDPVAAAKIDRDNARRTVRALEVAAVTGSPFSSFAGDWEGYPPEHVRVAGLQLEPEVLRQRIERRAERNFDGLVRETRELLERGYGDFLRTAHVIGYAEAAACIDGTLDRADAVGAIVKRDRALARRQMAWFRRDPRVRWFPVGPEGGAAVVDELEEYLRDG
jgi:tRNA dimethylallyltransferase